MMGPSMTGDSLKRQVPSMQSNPHGGQASQLSQEITGNRITDHSSRVQCRVHDGPMHVSAQQASFIGYQDQHHPSIGYTNN